MAGRLVLYPNELDRLLRLPGGPVGRFTNLTARRIANVARRNTETRLRRRTGRLASGYRVRVSHDPSGREGFLFTVGNHTTGRDPRRSASYFPAQELGSKAHTILPRRRNRPHGRLVFYVNGRKVVTKQVRHPGTRPRHMLRDAAEEVMRSLRGRRSSLFHE